MSNNGISSIIDNYGNIIDFIPLNEFSIKNIQIKISNNTKNYIWLHQIIKFIILLILGIALLKSKKNDSQQI